MPTAPRLHPAIIRYAFPLCFAVQAALLFAFPGLLPVWGDESFALAVAVQPLPELLRSFAGDINPPLYGILLHFWLRIPWPLEQVLAARILSAVLLLLAFAVIDRRWARILDPRARTWFLILWACSPSLLLFGRMARGYSLQLLLFALALGAALDLLSQAPRLRAILQFAVWEGLLLYAHYLPGIALLAGTLALAAWRSLHSRRFQPLAAAAAALSLSAALYSPWLPSFWNAIEKISAVTPGPPLGGSPLVNAAVRLGYLFCSFSFGETPPTWALLAGLGCMPAFLWLLWRGLAHPPGWLGLVIPAAIAACVGASLWVSFVFVPARLLFLLPFYLWLLAVGISRSGRAGILFGGLLVLISAASVSSYFRKSDFLNKAYLIPYKEIAGVIRQGTGGQAAIVIADVCNIDAWPLVRELDPSIRILLAGHGKNPEELLPRITKARSTLIWHFRATRDVCPGNANSRLTEELAHQRHFRRRLFVPYERRDRFFQRVLGWPRPYTHLLQLDEFLPEK